MNANDLAKLLEVDSWYKLVTREEIADTLRQQQTEIEALKQSKFDANNKVNLTDEEIIEVHINTPFINGYLNKNLIDFARAILRKAQEK
jgi:hypothetical protein